jgi:hypothetical protein
MGGQVDQTLRNLTRTSKADDWNQRSDGQACSLNTVACHPIKIPDEIEKLQEFFVHFFWANLMC